MLVGEFRGKVRAGYSVVAVYEAKLRGEFYSRFRFHGGGLFRGCAGVGFNSKFTFSVKRFFDRGSGFAFNSGFAFHGGV